MDFAGSTRTGSRTNNQGTIQSEVWRSTSSECSKGLQYGRKLTNDLYCCGHRSTGHLPPQVVGSGSPLGDWSAEQGLQLTWKEGDVWIAEIPIQAGHYEFKVGVCMPMLHMSKA